LLGLVRTQQQERVPEGELESRPVRGEQGNDNQVEDDEVMKGVGDPSGLIADPSSPA
jgi:hypothetical protein